MNTNVLLVNEVDPVASKRVEDVCMTALRTPEFAAFACVAPRVGARRG